jgi:predicted nuclease of restriction endonuclease-like (RecB) superfamily
MAHSTKHANKNDRMRKWRFDWLTRESTPDIKNQLDERNALKKRKTKERKVDIDSKEQTRPTTTHLFYLLICGF